MYKQKNEYAFFAVIITGRPVMIITEFMHNGALSNYLVVSIYYALQVLNLFNASELRVTSVYCLIFFHLRLCNTLFCVT